MSDLIAAADGAQMWDMRYKYPYDYTYKNEDGTDKNTVTYYRNASAKCVAPTAERAIALVKEFCPEAVILGVHHREGGEKNRVLIDPAVMPASPVTVSRPFTAEEIQKVLSAEKNNPAVLVPGPPALFAEEWAAIDYCIRQADEYDRVGLEDAAQAAAVLRGLRKRLGGTNG
ncbi:hypothetical protein EBZ39_00445 [bacterium]|nr:hypothetical protein [bacterium]